MTSEPWTLFVVVDLKRKTIELISYFSVPSSDSQGMKPEFFFLDLME